MVSPTAYKMGNGLFKMKVIGSNLKTHCLHSRGTIFKTLPMKECQTVCVQDA